MYLEKVLLSLLFVLFFLFASNACKLRKTNPGKFAKMFVVEINALISGIIDSSQHLQLEYDHYRKYHYIS